MMTMELRLIELVAVTQDVSRLLAAHVGGRVFYIVASLMGDIMLWEATLAWIAAI